MPGSAGGAAAGALPLAGALRLGGPLGLPVLGLRLACRWACPLGLDPDRLRFRPSAAGPLVLLGPCACALPGRGHQI